MVSALDDVSFTIDPGELLVVVGPNGAGKTTLVRTLARLARPTAGRVLLDGEDWLASLPESRREVGVLSHASWLYDGLTAAENLRFTATLYRLGDRERRVREALEAAGLESVADRPAGALSRGQAQRLAIARAALHDPRLLLFDEPFAGLDPAAAKRLALRLSELAVSGRTVLLTTHDLARVPAAASRWLILVAGRVRGAGPCAGLAPGDLEAAYERAMAGADA